MEHPIVDVRPASVFSTSNEAAVVNAQLNEVVAKRENTSYPKRLRATASVPTSQQPGMSILREICRNEKADTVGSPQHRSEVY